jgi:hypothetical protein
MKPSHGLILIFLTALLASCDQLGLDNPAAEQARVEAEGKAIGSGCRQTGRALEECYEINRRAPKAAIFAGWREMDAYMRENKIEEIKPDSPTRPPPAKDQPAEAGKESDPSGSTKPVSKDTAANAKPVAESKPADTAAAKKGRPALAH